MLSGVTATGNSYGVFLDSSPDNTLSGVAASNNTNVGVYIDDASHKSTLSVVTASNNGGQGIYILSSYNTFSGVTSSNNNSYGLHLHLSSYNYFTEILKVGNDCYVYGGLNPGLVAGLGCANDGPSDASLTTGITLAGSFVGKTYDDNSNSSDTGKAVSFPIDPTAFDWSNFENPFRGWGKDGDFGNANSRGRWTINDGAIWDRSLWSTDAVLVNSLTIHNHGDIANTITHTWSDDSTSTFLRNAIEIQGDGQGNDNTLCESYETCLYTRNMGSYQGHGALVNAPAFVDGVTIMGVTLKEYEYNGY